MFMVWGSSRAIGGAAELAERNCKRRLPCHISDRSVSVTRPVPGRLMVGTGGGRRTLNPHIVVRFLISRPHLKRLRLLVRTDRMLSRRSDLLTDAILNGNKHCHY